MADVYSATHRNGSRVALKVLHKELTRDASIVERFKREGYFANAIGHPGIVKAIDDDVTEDGCAFLVMELLEGETLEERRRRKGGRLPLADVLLIGDALLDVLAAAHARNVLHRDMKPDNVFLTASGEVKILDFGVARHNDGKSSSDMTGVGMVLGTPAFMPPEQALGRREEVDGRSDLWAVGATLFVALSGDVVHAGGNAQAKLITAARTPARPIREVMPSIPRSVAAVIDRALAFNRDDRWEDANAMREALRWARMSLAHDGHVLTQPNPDPIPAPAPTTRRPLLDEPTVAREYNPFATSASSASTNDVVTSAPPISQLEAPHSITAETVVAAVPSSVLSGPVFSLRNDPVFSLRRPKEDEEAPETQPGERVAASPADDEPRSIDVRLSFTRPMMAVPSLEAAPPGDAGTVVLARGLTLPIGAAPIAGPAPVAAAPTGPAPFFPPNPSSSSPPMQPPPAQPHAPTLNVVGGMTAPLAPPSNAPPSAQAPAAPASMRTSGPPPVASARPSGPSGPPSIRAHGSALGEVMAKPRGHGTRIALTIALGALAAIVVLAAVVRHRIVRAGETPTAAAAASGGPAVPAASASASASSAVTSAGAGAVTGAGAGASRDDAPAATPSAASAQAPSPAASLAAASPATSSSAHGPGPHRGRPRPRPKRPDATTAPSASPTNEAPSEVPSPATAAPAEAPSPDAPAAKTPTAPDPAPATPDGTGNN